MQAYPAIGTFSRSPNGHLAVASRLTKGWVNIKIHAFAGGGFRPITPLARRYGIRVDVKIARELAERAGDETLIGCVLRAAANALMMRGARLEFMNPLQSIKPLESMNSLVFAIKTLRAPAQLLAHLRLAMQLDNRHCGEPTITLSLAA